MPYSPNVKISLNNNANLTPNQRSTHGKLGQLDMALQLFFVQHPEQRVH